MLFNVLSLLLAILISAALPRHWGFNKRRGGSLDGWMDGWMDRWMNEWMYEWMYE